MSYLNIASIFLLFTLEVERGNFFDPLNVIDSDIKFKENGELPSSHVDSLLNPYDDTKHYKINWLNSGFKIDELQVLHDDTNSMRITTPNNESYFCKWKSLDKKKSKDSSNSFWNRNTFLILKPLFSKEICSYRLEQYWTYELCHGRFMRQFHEDNTLTKGDSQEYILGTYDLTDVESLESDLAEKVKSESKANEKLQTIQVDGIPLPYLEINMTGGTLCDLNNKPRFTRVLYVCNEDSKNELYSIKEIFTCEYEAIVLTPYLCLHSEFKVDVLKHNDIDCYPIDNAPQIPKSVEQFESDNYPRKIEFLFKTESGEKTKKEFTLDLQFNEDIHKKIVPKNVPNTKAIEEFLSGEMCLNGGTGWWRYEFCYGKSVSQYHEENGERKVTILLGKWDKNEHENWLKQNPKKVPKAGKTPKFVSHFYSNGDICEATQKQRQVEVKLKCLADENTDFESLALYLLEPKTCDYVLGIESPIICQLLSNTDKEGLLSYTNKNL